MPARRNKFYKLLAAAGLTVLLSFAQVGSVQAAAPPPENPQSGSSGLQGKVTSPPPTQAATITTPSNGASFDKLPITVSGLCKTDLLVKIFDNEIFMGAVICTNNSYSLQIDLFPGQNVLVARVYDSLDQVGPDSNKPTVTFTNSTLGEFGSRVTLTSVYGRRGTAPNTVLTWPIVVSGGTAPYAVSVDWGDGTPPDLISVATAGTFNIQHTYKSAGQYKVIIKATDKNGTVAYLQVVGVANGEVAASATDKSSSSQTIIVKWIWWPALLLIPFALISFFLGRRHQLYILRRNLERQQQAQQ
ncbi:MAG: Fibronectin type protein [Candidatus Saccharibacteria bacterium]|nr:Fibronectin type protein [Candidatus Saccharibacteria bacterium]